MKQLPNEYIGEMWDYLMEKEIATENELQLVTNINGFNAGAMEAILYARTGYRSFDQLEGEE